jgi:hypothetical protein
MRISAASVSNGVYSTHLGAKRLWFSVSLANMLSETSDAALVAAMIPAMLDGEDIEVDGPVSARLFYNLSGRHQDVIRSILPTCSRISIKASELYDRGPSAAGVATGFSGGIDSFSSIVDHYWKPCSPGFKLTHLLHNNVGAHGSPEKFRHSAMRMDALARRLNLPPLVVVDSNLSDFYDERLSFQQTHSHRNMAVALALQGGIRRFLYASTYRYRDVRFAPSNDIAFCDPVSFPHLSTERLDAVSVGGEYSRVEKTFQVSDFAQTYSALDVCTGGIISNRNCSQCAKCLRTMLTLDCAGRLDRYAEVFDLHKYEALKDWYIAHIMTAPDPFSRELAELVPKAIKLSPKSRLFILRDYVFNMSRRFLAPKSLMASQAGGSGV